MEKYPGRIPVFVSRHVKCTVPELEKRKFLIPRDLTVGQMLWIIRRKLSLPSDKALFMFVENSLPPSSARMGDLAAQYGSADGALRVVYTTESTFGSCSEADA